jgi:S-adenosylmethionine:tRNA ribosyltransferase-isomerase
LHVGMGTFLPIKGDTLQEHKMHEEYAEVSNETWQKIQVAKQRHKKVWALGTTVLRALESIPIGKLKHKHDGGYIGKTDIFIYPPYRFQVVDALLTNFHQPESTLLALVAAFAKSLDVVKKNYDYAIQEKFRLFSYGDLSVWIR